MRACSRCASTSASSASSSTAFQISPHSAAFSAGSGSPVSARPSARAWPTRRGKHPRAAAVRDQADRREALDELGRLRRDDDVAGERDVGAGARGDAVHPGDDRLRQARQRADQRVPALLDRLAEIDRLARRDRAVVEVLPGAEAAAGAGQHDHARIAEAGERVAQFLVHLRGEAVEPVRAVERDTGDRASALNRWSRKPCPPTSAKERTWTQTNLPTGRARHARRRRHRPGLGHQIEEAREGYARVSMMVRADMLNGHGIAHGGMIFALADSAFAYVCNGRTTQRRRAGVDRLPRQVREGETLIAEAKEVAREGRAGVTRVAVRTADGRPIAEFTGYSRTLGGPVIWLSAADRLLSSARTTSTIPVPKHRRRSAMRPIGSMRRDREARAQ